MPKAIVNSYPPDALLRRRDGRALIGISLNSHTTQSPIFLRRLLAWAHDQFGAFDLLVGDYLNRHNYIALEEATERSAIERARSEGRDVADRLRAVLAAEHIADSAVISSETLYDEPTFAGRLANFEVLYQTNELFKALIEEAVDAFLARKGRKLISNHAVRRHCIAYQLEELAMFELLGQSGHDVLAYAGAQLPVMKAIALKQLKGVSLALESLSLAELRFIDEGKT